MMYQGSAYVLPPMIVTGATLAGGLPTSPSTWRENVERSSSWPMPAKRAGAPVSSWPTSGVFLFSMAATYLVCMSSKVKYSDGHRGPVLLGPALGAGLDGLVGRLHVGLEDPQAQVGPLLLGRCRRGLERQRRRGPCRAGQERPAIHAFTGHGQLPCL